LSGDKNQLHAVRKPNELNTNQAFQIQLAEGLAEVHLSEVNIPHRD